MSPYRRYRRWLILNPVILLAYGAIALSDTWWPSLPRHVSGEIFPFFNWDLFSAARERGKIVTVRVTEVTGPKARASDLTGKLLHDPRDAAFLRDSRFQKTARALANGYWNEDEAARLQAQVDNFLRPYGVRAYDLVVLRYDPLAHHAGAEAPDVEVLGRFSIAEPR